jgi:hypothetical protein
MLLLLGVKLGYHQIFSMNVLLLQELQTQFQMQLLLQDLNGQQLQLELLTLNMFMGVLDT